MSKPQLVHAVPSFGTGDYLKSRNHYCSYEYNRPTNIDTLQMRRSVDHRPAEWTNGYEDHGRLPSFDHPPAPPLQNTNSDSRPQPVHPGPEPQSSRGFSSYRSAPESRYSGAPAPLSNQQLPSLSDILRPNSQHQHAFQRPSSARRSFPDPYDRNLHRPSSFSPGMSSEEQAKAQVSPSSNRSAPSSMSCESLKSNDSQKGGDLAGQTYGILGSATKSPSQRQDLEGIQERSNLSGYGNHQSSQASARHGSHVYSPEVSSRTSTSSTSKLDSARATRLPVMEEGRHHSSPNDHRGWNGVQQDVYENVYQEDGAIPEFSRPRNATESTYHASKTYPISTKTGYPSARHDAPMSHQRMSQHSDSLGPQGDLISTGLPKESSPPEYPQANDKLSSLIWDGNRFLPRLVRTENVQGKGLCYFYDDGSHCKAKIDGEDVNPSWGVTKAGKPRKRLAVACITCREKKIKCDPDYPKCKQCVKFDRVCMFKNAARAAQILKETYTNGEIGRGPQPSEQAHSVELIGSPSERRSNTEDSSVGFESTTSKKRKAIMKFDNRETLPSRYSQLFLESDLNQSMKRRRGASPSTVLKMITGALGSGNWSEELDWGIDPYEANPELVDHLMDLYFQHTNTAIYCMFPRRPFMRWLRSVEKTPDDRMLLYSMLALASRFTDDPNRKSYSKDLLTAAQYAVEHRHGKFSLQLVQSRILLGLYCFAANNPNEAWEYCGAGIRAAMALKLNVDNGTNGLSDDDTFEYGLNRHAIAECRRRTFWSIYLMDRFNGFSSGRACLINNDDIFVRLPCHETLFEDQVEVTNPFFDPSTSDDLTISQSGREHTGLGPMAFLVKISYIWGVVLAEIYRSANRSHGAYAERYEAFYSKTRRQLSRWLSDLPPSLVYSKENLIVSSTNNYLGTFLTMHSLRHTTEMKLNRYARSDQLTRERIMENLRYLNRHAREQLQMMICYKELVADGFPHLGIPFTGYSTSTACDILSAKVPKDKCSEVVDVMTLGSSVLENLQKSWHTCRKQKVWIAKRIEKVEAKETSHLLDRDDGGDSKDAGTEDQRPKLEEEALSHSQITIECISQPMEAPFAPVDDMAYSVDQDIYREAFANTPVVHSSHNGARRELGTTQSNSASSEMGQSRPKEIIEVELPDRPYRSG